VYRKLSTYRNDAAGMIHLTIIVIKLITKSDLRTGVRTKDHRT